MTITDLPTPEQIFEYIKNNGGVLRKKQMAEALKVPKNRRADFRRLLQKMERNNAFAIADTPLSPAPKNSIEIDNSHIKISGVSMLIVDSITADGDIVCRPERWIGQDFPHIYLQNANVQVGNRVLARSFKNSDGTYTAKIIKVIPHNDTEFLGICQQTKKGFYVTSTDKRDKNMYFMPHTDAVGADNTPCTDGDIVLVAPIRGRTEYLKNVKLKYTLGNIKNAHSYSLLSILKYDIPYVFPDEVLQQTENLTVPKLGNRVDLTPIPLVTIDGADARDFDDAVYAEKTDTGFKILVAIADVAHYVPSNSALCQHALLRGNSTYFADRVVPMLPEKLSNDLCSLIPHKRRACMAVWITLDTTGTIQEYTFIRAIMQSQARLTYEQVQSAYNGMPTDIDKTLLPHINTLYAAYHALSSAREKRGTLDLNVPENYVVFGEDGQISAIRPRQRLDSHKLIEEFMICANVAAACALQDKSHPHIMYRVHDVPPLDKLETLQSALVELGLTLPKGTHLTPHHFTRLLTQAQGTKYEFMLSELILRSQAQAQYSTDNLGHFGLALQKYCHFTSPIRRYSDILVHRALIEAYTLGDECIDPNQQQEFTQIAETICNTERRSQRAERETLDRYLAHYMEKHVGAEVSARISGVTERAIFLTLSETGADAVVFLKSLNWDYFIYSPENLAVIGERTNHIYRVGDTVVAEILTVSAIKGGIQCTITDGGTVGDTPPKKRPQNHRGRHKKYANKGKKPKKTYKKY